MMCLPAKFACNVLRLIPVAGIEFATHILSVCEVEYTLFYRDLKEVLSTLLRRCSRDLELPSVRNATDPISALWHGSEYQKHLKAFLAQGALPERDVLMPLELFSGGFLSCSDLECTFACRDRGPAVLAHKLCADETNLASFNTTSDQSSTYPLLVSLGLRRSEVRLKPWTLETLAFLPKYLARKHGKTSSKTRAHHKREVVWRSIAIVLYELSTRCEDAAVSGYTYVLACALLCKETRVLMMKAQIHRYISVRTGPGHAKRFRLCPPAQCRSVTRSVLCLVSASRICNSVLVLLLLGVVCSASRKKTMTFEPCIDHV